MKLEELKKLVEKSKLPTNAKWWKWRKEFALYIIDYINSPELDVSKDNLRKVLLNGAQNWKEYSESGSPYCYDEDIANALYSPTEARRMLKKDYYDWIDIQANALYQSFLLCAKYCK